MAAARKELNLITLMKRYLGEEEVEGEKAENTQRNAFNEMTARVPLRSIQNNTDAEKKELAEFANALEGQVPSDKKCFVLGVAYLALSDYPNLHSTYEKMLKLEGIKSDSLSGPWSSIQEQMEKYETQLSKSSLSEKKEEKKSSSKKSPAEVIQAYRQFVATPFSQLIKNWIEEKDSTVQSKIFLKICTKFLNFEEKDCPISDVENRALLGLITKMEEESELNSDQTAFLAWAYRAGVGVEIDEKKSAGYLKTVASLDSKYNSDIQYFTKGRERYLTGGFVHSSTQKAGIDADRKGAYDEAIAHYEKAIIEEGRPLLRNLAECYEKKSPPDYMCALEYYVEDYNRETRIKIPPKRIELARDRIINILLDLLDACWERRKKTSKSPEEEKEIDSMELKLIEMYEKEFLPNYHIVEREGQLRYRLSDSDNDSRQCYYYEFINEYIPLNRARAGKLDFMIKRLEKQQQYERNERALFWACKIAMHPDCEEKKRTEMINFLQNLSTKTYKGGWFGSESPNMNYFREAAKFSLTMINNRNMLNRNFPANFEQAAAFACFQYPDEQRKQITRAFDTAIKKEEIEIPFSFDEIYNKKLLPSHRNEIQRISAEYKRILTAKKEPSSGKQSEVKKENKETSTVGSPPTYFYSPPPDSAVSTSTSSTAVEQQLGSTAQPLPPYSSNEGKLSTITPSAPPSSSSRASSSPQEGQKNDVDQNQPGAAPLPTTTPSNPSSRSVSNLGIFSASSEGKIPDQKIGKALSSTTSNDSSPGKYNR